MLWGQAAGRCEFRGCNEPLWKSLVTQQQVNLAEAAHIWSFSPNGPRGHEGVPTVLLNDCSNLMLVCQACHTTMDQDKDGELYSVSLLQEMKAEHERRIEIATSITPALTSQVLHFGANIGVQGSPLRWESTAPALFPGRYPASQSAIELGLGNSATQDHDREFWTVEARNLVRHFETRIRERRHDGALGHLSVFALAPQPLLILLGSLLSDIQDAEVFQLHREPRQTWTWPEWTQPTPKPTLNEPEFPSGIPALVLSLSGTVVADRVESALGEPVSIWEVTVPSPNNDLIKTRAQLGELRALLRHALDRIKTTHGQSSRLHIFPAAPLSVAIELGRVRSPKADMPWRIYDQNNHQGGFSQALDLPEGLSK